MESCEEAMDIIKEYEDIIKTNKKNIFFFAYQQDKGVENLRNIENLKFLLNNLTKITKGTIIFKINIVKLVDKYTKMINHQ